MTVVAIAVIVNVTLVTDKRTDGFAIARDEINHFAKFLSKAL